MTRVEGYYGRDIELPDDLLYEMTQHMWLRPCERGVELGFTHAGIVLISGLVFIDFIAEVGWDLEEGEALLGMETYKAMFEVHTPLAGKMVWLNPEIDEDKATILDTQFYQQPVAVLEPVDPGGWQQAFLTVEQYKEALERGEGDHCGAGARAARAARRDPDDSG